MTVTTTETEEIGVLLSSPGPMANSNWWRPHGIEQTEHVEQTLWIRRVAKRNCKVRQRHPQDPALSYSANIIKWLFAPCSKF